jgi:hypothetical protein
VRGVLAQAVHDLRTRQLRRPRWRAAARAHPAAAAAPVVPPPERDRAPARRALGRWCSALLPRSVGTQRTQWTGLVKTQRSSKHADQAAVEPRGRRTHTWHRHMSDMCYHTRWVFGATYARHRQQLPVHGKGFTCPRRPAGSSPGPTCRRQGPAPAPKTDPTISATDSHSWAAVRGLLRGLRARPTTLAPPAPHSARKLSSAPLQSGPASLPRRAGPAARLGVLAGLGQVRHVAVKDLVQQHVVDPARARRGQRLRAAAACHLSPHGLSSIWMQQGAQLLRSQLTCVGARRSAS